MAPDPPQPKPERQLDPAPLPPPSGVDHIFIRKGARAGSVKRPLK